MIWFDVKAAYAAALLSAYSNDTTGHKNPLLLGAINTAAGAVLPEVRSDTLVNSDNGVTGVRFIRARNRAGIDSGFMALVNFNGAPALVARSDRLLELNDYPFFEAAAALVFVDVLKKRYAMPHGTVVQMESLSREKGFGMSLGRPAKVQAYAKLRSATIDKFHADKAKKQIDLHALTALSNETLTTVSNHANAWLVDATARHVAAKAAYQALGGLVV